MKSFLSGVDKKYLNGTVRRVFGQFYLSRVNKESGRSYTVHYTKNPDSELSGLCDLYGSDKGELVSSGNPYIWPSHTYADFYEEIFRHCRNDIRRVFECGIGQGDTGLPLDQGVDGYPGASLRVWKDYFPNAMIYGADIDKEVLFQEERINTFFVDQTSDVFIREMWGNIAADNFDIIIDDGLHTFEAGICLLENSINNLAAEGVYIIEDVKIRDVLKYREYFRAKNYEVQYVNLFSAELPVFDNSLIVIRK